MTYADLARVLKIDRGTITHWREGRLPRRSTIEKITDWSGGTIPLADWFDPPPPQESRRRRTRRLTAPLPLASA
jgi:transcriptional regulator with XRE-family HTH domain